MVMLFVAFSMARINLLLPIKPFTSGLLDHPHRGPSVTGDNFGKSFVRSPSRAPQLLPVANKAFMVSPTAGPTNESATPASFPWLLQGHLPCPSRQTALVSTFIPLHRPCRRRSSVFVPAIVDVPDFESLAVGLRRRRPGA